MTQDELLLRLQPPTMPVEPSHWPPAVAWWVLLGLVILAGILWLIWRVYRHKQRFYHQARYSLDTIENDYQNHNDAQRLLLDLAKWLRRVSKSIHPDPNINSLHGEQWLVFLEQNLPAPVFSQGPGQIFGQSLYQSGIQFDEQQVLQLCHQWLSANRYRSQPS